MLYTVSSLIMILLALDQSLSATGQALFNYEHFYNTEDFIDIDIISRVQSIEIETLITSSKLSFEDRLLIIYNNLCLTVESNKVDSIVYEGIFKSLNVNTLIKLAKVQGLVELIIGKYQLKSCIVTPKEWQSHFKLDKIKDKNKSIDYIQSENLIVNKITESKLVPPLLNTHTADAICIGLYHLKTFKLLV